jgi:tetratricopeptide (TPR) repeat protein
MSQARQVLTPLLALLFATSACYADEKKSGYPFMTPPAKALEVLAGLGKAPVSADEESLFAAARDGKLGKWSFDEAALLASGVTDGAKRKEYVARLDDLEAKARKALEGAKSAHERGERLLQFLHDGPMAKGYEAKQTRLDVVLDTGKYNCVSSAVLYNVLARRLGLEARAVEVPGHVYSVLVLDGRSVDVETTNAHGFDPANPEQREKLRKEKGIEVAASNYADKREVRELGLAAVVYANRSGMLSDAGKHHEAAVAGFCALSLDPESDGGATNALLALTKWGLALSKEAKYEKALRVTNAALSLGPKDSHNLRNNRIVYLSEWAAALVKDGKEDEALAVLRKALAEVGKDDRNAVLELQAEVYTRRGEELVKAGEWDPALALAERGLKKIDAGAVQNLRRWRNGVYLRRADAEEKAGRFDKAVSVLEAGLAADPDESSFATNLGCLVRDRAKQLHDAGKRDEAKATLVRMRKRFAACGPVQGAGTEFVAMVQDEPLGQAKYGDALDLFDFYSEVVKDDGDREGLAGRVYDREAKPFIDKGTKEAWAAAAAVYEKGLKRYPDNKHIRSNLEVCRQRAKQ